MNNTSSTSDTSTGFGFWGSLPLSRKLLAAFGALALLTLALGGIAFIDLNRVEQSYESALVNGEQLQIDSLLVLSEFELLRELETEFVSRWQDEGYETAHTNYIVPLLEDLVLLRKAIAELAFYAPVVGTELGADIGSKFEEDLVLMDEDLALYEKDLDILLQLVQERGFEDTGLEGEMRLVAANLESKLSNREGSDKLLVTLLQIRRREKDYLARGDQKYIENVHELIAELKQQVSSSDQLPLSNKREISAVADQYLAAFDAVVEKEIELASANEEIHRVEAEMVPLVEEFITTGSQLSELDVATARDVAARSNLTLSIVIVAALVIAVVLAVFFARQITRPVIQLTNTAQEIATGKFDLQAQVTSSDEIGTLAATFNSMTSQLGRAFEDVQRRAAELATVAEVSTATSTILDVKNLLQEVVDLTKERFNLYHSHIYLLDEAGENLVLASGAGEPGRQMVAEGRAIPLDREQSLVARAARDQKGVTVNDVTQAPDFLPNPLLPDTRAELAVPMIVAGRVIGVFDVQSDVVGRFTDADINIQTTLATQVATAIQNVRVFEQSKAQADLESLVNAIGQKIQRATTIEDTLQTAIREVGLALGASRVSANLQVSQQDNGNVKNN